MTLTQEQETSCPNCSEQGFDGQGYVTVEGTQMYLQRCWSCGTRFACEDTDDAESHRRSSIDHQEIAQLLIDYDAEVIAEGGVGVPEATAVAELIYDEHGPFELRWHT